MAELGKLKNSNPLLYAIIYAIFFISNRENVDCFCGKFFQSHVVTKNMF